MDGIGDQLAVILIGRGHKDFVTLFLGSDRDCANDIIRPILRHFQHGNVHRLQDAFDNRHRLADILRRLLALRLVFGKRFVAERSAFGVKRHR